MRNLRRSALTLTMFAVLSYGCGSGGGGGSGGAPAPSSADLLGNFVFVYTIQSEWTDRYTIDEKSDAQTSEETDIYFGYDADARSIQVAGAWYPSRTKFLVATESLIGIVKVYDFVIEPDNSITGEFFMSLNGTLIPGGYGFHSSRSRKYPTGRWSRMAPENLRSNALSGADQRASEYLMQNNDTGDALEESELAKSVDRLLTAIRNN